MRTWKVDQPAFRVLAAIILGLLVVGLLVYLVRSIVGEPPPWYLLPILLVSMLTPLIVWRQSRAYTTLTSEGVEVYDGFRSRLVLWPDVAEAFPHGRSRPVLSLRMNDGASIVLLGVPPADLPEVRVIIAEHR